MKKTFLYFFFCAFILVSTHAQTGGVGINTESPTETLDVNGTLRVREVNAGDSDDSILVVDEDGVIHYVTADMIVEAADASGAIEAFTTGVTPPTNSGDENTGDTYLDTASQTWWYFNGTSWIKQSGASLDINNALSIGSDGLLYVNTSAFTVTANNGINIAANGDIHLGGSLIQPTEITTDDTNTLAISGLETGNTATDEVVSINPTSGVLTKTSIASLTQQEQIVYTASEGDTVFSTPSTITNSNKIDVYRNGVRIKATPINPTQIELEPEATCYAGDEIRIVQLK